VLKETLFDCKINQSILFQQDYSNIFFIFTQFFSFIQLFFYEKSTSRMKTNKQLFLIIFSFIVISSCTNTEDKYRSQILGEWYPLDEENLIGYHFMENNRCENKLGYYEYFDSIYGPPKIECFEKCQIYSHWENIINYRGNTTFYDIQKDCLILFDLTKKTLIHRKFRFLSSDTLLLSNPDTQIDEKYYRKSYPVDNEAILDEVIFFLPAISRYNMREKYVSIKKTGEVVICTGSRWDFHSYKMNKEDFDRIEYLFKKADRSILMEKQIFPRKIFPSFIESTNSSISFVRGNKIKTIETPVETINTKEFLWAYFSVLFGLSQMHLTPCKIDDYDNLIFFPEIVFSALKFHTKNRTLDLSGSECFYLRNLISQGKETKQTFIPIYKLKESFYDKEGIKTDGRFYRCIQNGREITIDIGFNFIEENGLAAYFN